MTGPAIGNIDIAVIILYILLIVGIGIWAGLRKKKHENQSSYFLAGGILSWPVIGLALFSTNISTIHLVSLAQEGYVNGLAYGAFEWMAIFTLVILAVFFAPFYIKSKVATLPDFLEKRYSYHSRDWLAVLSIISAIFIHIGFTLYTGAIVLEGIFGINNQVVSFLGINMETRLLIIAVIAAITALYTIIGGLLAVVVTESIQTVVLLAGSITITLIGLHYAGGWSEVVNSVEPVRMTVLRGADDPSGLPWYGIMLGYPIIGIWYWCADQTIVQRVLGAKSEYHARMGPIFTGFLKLLPVFIFVFPGVICYSLVQKGAIPALQNANASDTFSHLITHLLPVGLKGLVAAALLAALMSTVSGALNSMATLFSYDIYSRFKPGTSPGKLVRIGRIATFVGMLIAIFWSPMLAHYDSIFQGISTLISYIAPPITAVFLWGIFSKKASAYGAKLTLYIGSLFGLLVFIIDWNKNAEWLVWMNYDIPFMMMSFYLFVFSSAVLFVCSYYKPQVHTEESAALIWDKSLLEIKGESNLKNRIFLVSTGVLLLTIICLLIIF
jgi:solute:Na+ symporter, SSS family